MSGYLIDTPATFRNEGSVTYQATSNQIVFGTTNTTTLSSTAPSASRTYTLPDAGANANIVLDTAGAMTITNSGTNTYVLTASAATTASWVNPTTGFVTSISGTAN